MALPTTGLVIPTVFADGHNIDWDGDTWKCALFNSSWSPSLTSALGYSTTNECSGTGYTAGGKALTGVSITRTGGQFLFTADDVEWTASTLTDVAAAAVYSDTATSPVADPIVAVFQLAVSGANSGGTFTVKWPDSPATNTVIHIPGAS